ncbi:DUF1800 family protein [Aureitalea marina]|uniref:DUF1800 family protein n=1 Tax=Aureitalea marina TaxID=930804 RepID=UPI000CF2ED7D|nr:DUF1800 family protein [Aureitalea marina]
METELLTSCNTASISPYVPDGNNSWDVQKVQHVFRRLGFGATLAEVDSALNQSPGDFIDQLVDDAMALPVTTAPPWGYFAVNDFDDFDNENQDFIQAWRIQTGNDLASEGLRGRMTFFWSNHFVTELETYSYAPTFFNTIGCYRIMPWEISRTLFMR